MWSLNHATMEMEAFFRKFNHFIVIRLSKKHHLPLFAHELCQPTILTFLCLFQVPLGRRIPRARRRGATRSNPPKKIKRARPIDPAETKHTGPNLSTLFRASQNVLTWRLFRKYGTHTHTHTTIPEMAEATRTRYPVPARTWLAKRNWRYVEGDLMNVFGVRLW